MINNRAEDKKKSQSKIWFGNPQDTKDLLFSLGTFSRRSSIRYVHCDVWVHVADLSSAHVYLRQSEGEKLDDISEGLL